MNEISINDSSINGLMHLIEVASKVENLGIVGVVFLLFIVLLIISLYLLRLKVKDSDYVKTKVSESLCEIKDDLQEIKTLIMTLRGVVK